MRKESFPVKSGVTTKAFTAIEMLLALLVAGIVLTVSFRIIGVFRKFTFPSFEETQDHLALCQLRLYLAEKEVPLQEDGTTLTIHTEDHDRTIKCVNGKLMVQDGTLVFLHDVKNVWFSFEEDRFFLDYEKKGIHRHVWIAFGSFVP